MDTVEDNVSKSEVYTTNHEGSGKDTTQLHRPVTALATPTLYVQHPPPCCSTFVPFPGVTVFVFAVGVAAPILPNASQLKETFVSARQPYRSLICFAIVKNACSTFVAVFADVSRKGIFNWSANS